MKSNVTLKSSFKLMPAKFPRLVDASKSNNGSDFKVKLVFNITGTKRRY